MKRRNFVFHSAIGFLGAGLAPASVFRFGSKGMVDTWLIELTPLVILQKRSMIFGGDPVLVKALEIEALPYEKFGYRKENQALYLYNNGQTAFNILVKRDAENKMIDVILPVMDLRKDGKWERATTLSGFQVEAIAHTAKKLLELNYSPAEIRALLMPSRPNSQKVGSHFHTKEGTVTVVTTIGLRHASSEIIVRKGDQVIFKDKINSLHCLSCNAFSV